MNYKLALLGKKEEILPFKGLGVVPLSVDTAEEAETLLLSFRKNPEKEYAIIFLLEDLFQKIDHEVFEKISAELLPVLVPIPGLKGATGYGEDRMKKFVEQAVGSDIFAS